MKKKLKAFSLVELLLGVALFGLLIASVVTLTLDAVRTTRNSSTKIYAAQKIKEIQNALVENKDAVWSSITSKTDAGNFHLSFVNNKYTFIEGTDNSDGIALSFSITNAHRDADRNITPTGTVDLHTRTITITAYWVDFLGVTNSISSIIYVSDWTALKKVQTTYADFQPGDQIQTVVTNYNGGEVKLSSTVYADWCKPSISLSAYDLPGQGIAKTIFATVGSIYMGTGSNASGVSFAKLQFIPSETPTVTTLGLFDGYKTTDVFSDGSYAYVTTETNSEEVIILNSTTPPYTKIGYYNAPVNSPGVSVYVNGNNGFLAEDNKIYSFNLTSKTGSRPGISQITLGGYVTDMFGRGNYVYVTLRNSTTAVQIVDISNPAAMSIVGQININNSAATSVYVNDAGTRAYVVTPLSATYGELFLVDITTKTGTKYPFSSFDSAGMTPKDVTAPEGSKRIVIVGSGGTQQYQVINIDTETTPVKCGGMTIGTGVNALFSIIESNGNAYSYVVTGEANSELKVIRGGAGGGNEQGFGVFASGDFTSTVIDTESATSQYYSLDWYGTLPANAGIKFQLRTGNTLPLTSAWVGPDGTSLTYFSGQQSFVIPTALSNNRYIQYKAFFTSADTIATAILDQITVTYQK